MRNKTEFFLNSSKIAVIRTDRLGDFILTLNMFKAIKEVNPNAVLTAIINKYAEPLIYKQFFIDNLITISDSQELKEIFEKNNFDVCFFPRPRLNECWYAFRSKIPLRIGTAYRYYSFLFNYKIYEHRKNAIKHESEYNVSMVNSISGTQMQFDYPKIYCNTEWKNDLKKKLDKLNINLPKDYFICHPGSGGSARELEAENFALLNKYLTKRFQIKCVITGVEKEFEKCDLTNSLSENCLNICGKLSLTEMIALIDECRFFISNSTGVLHIASALGKPVICFYPNSPHISARRWGPNPEKSIVITPPVQDKKKIDDMTLITFDKILEKIENSNLEKLLEL